jgi:hypothetical protein
VNFVALLVSLNWGYFLCTLGLVKSFVPHLVIKSFGSPLGIREKKDRLL